MSPSIPRVDRWTCRIGHGWRCGSRGWRSEMRRHPLSVVIGILCAATLNAADVTDTRGSKFAKLRPVGLEEVRWTKDAEGEGFWAERMETLQSSSIPAMWEIMK